MRTHSTQKILPGMLIFLLLATLLVNPVENMGAWFQELFDWLHVPIFGLVSLAVLALVPTKWSAERRLVSAFLGSMLLAVLSEAVQIPLPRDASVHDIFADGYGVVSFLLFATAGRLKPFVSVVAIGLALAILGWSLQPLASTSRAILLRNAQFPVIYGGGFESDMTFINLRNLSISTESDSSLDGLCSRIVIPRSRRSAIEFHELVSDWSNFSSLRLEMTVEGKKYLDLMLRIHDRSHTLGNQSHGDRFNQSILLSPGHNSIRIPLENIRDAPLLRPMDMTKIEAIIIFANPAASQRVFNLCEIRLN